MKCKYYQWTLSDGSIWEVPMCIIEHNRSTYYHESYPDEFPTLDSALADTKELFSDDYEAHDWAVNNMNWDDVERFSKQINSGMVDMQEEWVNPYEYKIIER